MDADQWAMMHAELGEIRQIEEGENKTTHRGKIRRRPRLWMTLHTEELDELKRRGRVRQVSVAAQLRWAMAQPDQEAALQRLTGIGTEELLDLPADPGFKPRRDSPGWRRRSINWK